MQLHAFGCTHICMYASVSRTRRPRLVLRLGKLLRCAVAGGELAGANANDTRFRALPEARLEGAPCIAAAGAGVPACAAAPGPLAEGDAAMAGAWASAVSACGAALQFTHPLVSNVSELGRS